MEPVLVHAVLEEQYYDVNATYRSAIAVRGLIVRRFIHAPLEFRCNTPTLWAVRQEMYAHEVESAAPAAPAYIVNLDSIAGVPLVEDRSIPEGVLRAVVSSVLTWLP